VCAVVRTTDAAAELQTQTQHHHDHQHQHQHQHQGLYPLPFPAAFPSPLGHRQDAMLLAFGGDHHDEEDEAEGTDCEGEGDGSGADVTNEDPNHHAHHGAIGAGLLMEAHDDNRAEWAHEEEGEEEEAVGEEVDTRGECGSCPGHVEAQSVKRGEAVKLGKLGGGCDSATGLSAA
jgi:hypothetical protein